MAQKEIKVGDVVQLKSGGPLMTVSEIISNKVKCEWFDKNEHKEKQFQKVILNTSQNKIDKDAKELLDKLRKQG